MKRVGKTWAFLFVILLLSINFIPISNGQDLQETEPPTIHLVMDTTDVVLDFREETDSNRVRITGNISIIKPEDLRDKELHVDIIRTISPVGIYFVPKRPFILNSTTDELHLPFYVLFLKPSSSHRSITDTYSLSAEYYYDDDEEDTGEMFLTSGSVEIIGNCKVDYGYSIDGEVPAYFNEWYTQTLFVINKGYDPATVTLEPINLPSYIKCELSTYSCYLEGGESEDVIVKLTQTRGEAGYHEVEIQLAGRTHVHNHTIIATLHFESQNPLEHQIRSNIGQICGLTLLSLIIIATIVISVVFLVRKMKR